VRLDRELAVSFRNRAIRMCPLNMNAVDDTGNDRTGIGRTLIVAIPMIDSEDSDGTSGFPDRASQISGPGLYIPLAPPFWRTLVLPHQGRHSRPCAHWRIR
jgi:hypothetical protein